MGKIWYNINKIRGDDSRREREARGDPHEKGHQFQSNLIVNSGNIRANEWSITLERSGNPLGELSMMSIENPVIYVPIRHLATVNWRLSTFLGPLHLSRILYKSALFLQNKANFPDAQMNITSATTVNYINEPRTTNYELIMKNKPNQSLS